MLCIPFIVFSFQPLKFKVCSEFIVKCAECSVKFAVSIVLRLVISVICAVSSVQCEVCSVQCAVLTQELISVLNQVSDDLHRSCF